MNFLTRCDVPNWATILFFALCWMLSVLAHFMKNYAVNYWTERAEAKPPSRGGEGE